MDGPPNNIFSRTNAGTTNFYDDEKEHTVFMAMLFTSNSGGDLMRQQPTQQAPGRSSSLSHRRRTSPHIGPVDEDSQLSARLFRAEVPFKNLKEELGRHPV